MPPEDVNEHASARTVGTTRTWGLLVVLPALLSSPLRRMRPHSASHSANGGVGVADGAAGLETAVRALAARRRRIIIGVGDLHQRSEERQFSGPTARSWDAIRQRIPLDPSAALVDSFGSNAAGTDLHSSASAAHLDSKDRVSSTAGGPQQARRLAQLHSQLEQVKVWTAAREQELIDQVRHLEMKLKGVSEVNRNLAIEVIRQRRGVDGQEPSAYGATRTTPGQQSVGATSLEFLEATEAAERWKGRCLAAEATARIVQQRCAAAESRWSRSSTRGNSPPLATRGVVHQRTQSRESPRKRPGTAGAGSGCEKQPTHFADVADASPVDVLRALERAMVTDTSLNAPNGAWSPLLSDTNDAYEPLADDGELHWAAPVERACSEPTAHLKGLRAVSRDRSLQTPSHSAAPLASVRDEPRPGRGPTGRQRLAEAVQRMRYYSRSGSSRPGDRDHSVL
jgi:hypothetical protein